jgi:hypothetical protein
MSCSYAVLRDFAGPVATVLAAIVVVGVTWRFSSQQAKTARGQLRLDLFDKRYAAYKDIEKRLALVLNVPGSATADEVAQLFLAFDEAALFFSPATCEWLRTIKDDCKAFAEAAAHEGSGDARMRAALKKKLVDYLRAMPARFHDDLSLGQLTSD